MVVKFFITGMKLESVAVAVRIRFTTAFTKTRNKKQMTINLTKTIKPIFNKWSVKDNKEQTFCNMFIADVMATQGYYAFAGLMANQIIDIMELDASHWRKINPLDFDMQSIVIAGLKDNPHGHICVLISGSFIASGKWHKYVPLCANIGANNFYGNGISFAFRTEPNYYLFSA
jgi:hypothetical protein